MLGLHEILSFSKIFEDEIFEDYLSRIDEIPRDLLINTATHLLSFYHTESIAKDHKELLSQWFCEGNNAFANEINDRINSLPNKTIILNARSSLTLFESVLSSDNTSSEISNEEFEVLLFKIYLAINEQLNLNDDKVLSSVKDDVPYSRIFCLAIANSLPTFDITNYDSNSVFVSQVVKAIYLLEFLESRLDTQMLLQEFYRKFEVNGYKEFLGKLLPVSFNVIASNQKGNIDIVLNDDAEFDSNSAFLDRLSINNINDERSADFLTLRANPLIKISRDTYRIIYPLFVLEKNFNGLYFLLKEVNDTLDRANRVNLRQLVTFDFSEKYILYSIIERAFEKKYLKLRGEQMTTPGAPDYYIRNGNKVFIFESKDILINADVKESYDFEKYESELKDKLYYHIRNHRESPKAVKQLCNFSRSLLDGSFREDSRYKSNSIKIYPIIVLHNRQLDIVGLNNLINVWFKIETELIEDKTLKISNIQMPTIIGIETLILIHEMLSRNEIKLEKILEEYQYYISDKRIKAKRYKNEAELHAEMQNQLASFNMYIQNRFSFKVPNLFEEKGISILS
ncbi:MULTISPECIES: hypothetical protein [unclassified Carboxylicivirga]|uniref:hypothetical protein n=1 Tax=Carboxylicivirga TaxID=1628153 RepID=UPI003D357554